MKQRLAEHYKLRSQTHYSIFDGIDQTQFNDAVQKKQVGQFIAPLLKQFPSELVISFQNLFEEELEKEKQGLKSEFFEKLREQTNPKPQQVIKMITEYLKDLSTEQLEKELEDAQNDVEGGDISGRFDKDIFISQIQCTLNLRKGDQMADQTIHQMDSEFADEADKESILQQQMGKLKLHSKKCQMRKEFLKLDKAYLQELKQQFQKELDNPNQDVLDSEAIDFIVFQIQLIDSIIL